MGIHWRVVFYLRGSRREGIENLLLVQELFRRSRVKPLLIRSLIFCSRVSRLWSICRRYLLFLFFYSCFICLLCINPSCFNLLNFNTLFLLLLRILNTGLKSSCWLLRSMFLLLGSCECRLYKNYLYGIWS